jgi:hypothetical protein
VQPPFAAAVRQTTETARLNNGAAVIVEAVAEAHHLSVRQKSLKVEGLARELLKFARERLLFFLGQKVRTISEPLGKRSGAENRSAWPGGKEDRTQWRLGAFIKP